MFIEYCYGQTRYCFFAQLGLPLEFTSCNFLERSQQPQEISLYYISNGQHIWLFPADVIVILSFVILAIYIQVNTILECPFCSENQVLCGGQALNLTLKSQFSPDLPQDQHLLEMGQIQQTTEGVWTFKNYYFNCLPSSVVWSETYQKSVLVKSLSYEFS